MKRSEHVMLLKPLNERGRRRFWRRVWLWLHIHRHGGGFGELGQQHTSTAT